MVKDFFPSEDYKLPITSNYMKFLEGDNTFRVLSSSIVGWEYWNIEGKPVRNREPFDDMPEDIKTEKNSDSPINPEGNNENYPRTRKEPKMGKSDRI